MDGFVLYFLGHREQDHTLFVKYLVNHAFALEFEIFVLVFDVFNVLHPLIQRKIWHFAHHKHDGLYDVNKVFIEQLVEPICNVLKLLSFIGYQSVLINH